MKAAIIYYQYPLYENGSYIQEQVDALCQKCESVVLFATHYPPEAKFTAPKNLKIVWIGRVNLPLLSDIYFNLAVFFKALFRKDFRSADIINVVCARGVLAAIWLKWFFKKPLVLTVEIINSEETSLADKLYNRVQKYLFTRRHFDRIICWSKFHYQKYLKVWGVPPAKINFITCGINLSLFDRNVSGEALRKKYLKNKDEKLIVFAKPMYEYNRKSAELLLSALDSLPQKDKIRVLFGSGEQVGILKEKVKELRLEKQVDFMEPVPLNQIPSYIAAADLIVLSFVYEATTARSLLEALAMAKPVIVTKVGEIPGIVTNGKNALVVAPEKLELAAAIKKVLSDSKLSQEIAEGGYNLIKQKYSIEAVADQTVGVYNLLVRQKE